MPDNNDNNQASRRRNNAAKKAVRDTLQGRSFLSFDFFKRNSIYVIAATVMMLMYISNKYVCQSSMKEVMDLRGQLENAKTDRIGASTTYNSMIRESQMKALVDTMHINLGSPEQPPFELD